MYIVKQIFIIILLCIINAKESFNYELSFYDYSAISIDGDTIRMDKYRGKKILLVNVASKCRYTSQYNALQRLHEIYEKKLAVLGFPSNEYFWQEPGNNQEIKTFCMREYGVTFQMFEKIHVKGKKQHPIYNWLTDSKLNGWNDDVPSWNFCKYLIDEEGRLIEFYSSRIEPIDTIITRHLENRNIILPIIEEN